MYDDNDNVDHDNNNDKQCRLFVSFGVLEEHHRTDTELDQNSFIVSVLHITRLLSIKLLTNKAVF